jgi:hypothetical protein
VSELVQQRIPVVGGLGYAERVRRLPSTFTATLVREPENRYFPTAVAVHVNGEKVGYLAPEVSRELFEALKSRSEPVNCPGRRSCVADHETSGVELLLDLSDLRL